MTLRPLDGVRIISVEQYGAAPFATMYMADMGADVIKIEQPPNSNGRGGDSSRASGPHFLGPNNSHFFQTFNKSKKSLTLNLKNPDAKEVLHRLVAGADAVTNNMRGAQVARNGLNYESLKACNPAIVCGHLSGYGRKGPRADWPAYDYLAQAEAGFMALTGEPDGPPQRMGLSIIDYLGGITLAFSVTAGIVGALKSGKGRDIDVTLFDVAMHQLTYPATWYLNEGDVVERRPNSGHPSVVPCEVMPTGDGSIFVMCVLPKFWEAMCNGLGRPDLIEDARFNTPGLRYQNRDDLMALLNVEMKTRTTAEWMARLGGKVPLAPILSLPDALENPFFVESDGIESMDLPQRKNFRMVASPIRLDGHRATGKPAPELGADTDQILTELGYSTNQITALRGNGTI
ncbi:MAG: CoA transferase [Alphaproteobacteria bacterium]|jgi:succinate---hydroxymethylglutarate CoA-transferase|nr:CoA transferase [Alphaproteobacteria bacterium]MBT4017519.1 CoA transferase [Alphaproteobacteria bacterium]MBT5161125.1 CoA transferase [Alphaproteobacteria bacterium]